MCRIIPMTSPRPRRCLPKPAGSPIPTQASGYGGSNYVAFSNPRMDELIEQAEHELDPAKQKAIWADMQTIYATELPVLPLFFRADPHVVPKWLKGYTPTGHGDLTT